MASVQKFEDLEVWQLARLLNARIYSITRDSTFRNDSELRDQLRGASISVMSNIAEGFERSSNKDFVRFLFISKGSLGELRSLFYILQDQQMLNVQTIETLMVECEGISRRVTGLIKYLSSSLMEKRNAFQEEPALYGDFKVEENP
jgi:four helix bundle protein